MSSVLSNFNNLFVKTLPPWQTMPLVKEEINEKNYPNYSFIISGRICYFNELLPELKRKFICPEHNYIKGKEFHYIGHEQKEEIPILVSASVVQVSVGHKNYRKQEFKILKSELC